MKGLAKRRMIANLTQAQVANALSKDRSTIAKWETGTSSPNAQDLPAIANLYNCSIDSLFYEDNENTVHMST